jgi:hypothetical protein
VRSIRTMPITGTNRWTEGEAAEGLASVPDEHTDDTPAGYGCQDFASTVSVADEMGSPRVALRKLLKANGSRERTFVRWTFLVTTPQGYFTFSYPFFASISNGKSASAAFQSAKKS